MHDFKSKVRSMIERPIAHRGLHVSDGAPENSIAALEAAVDAGYGVECDVQLTRDDVAVVFHDETLDRLTGETGAVRERSVAELSEMRLLGTDERIPTLEAFVAHAAGRTPLFIELKRQDKRVEGQAPHRGGNDALIRAAAEAIADYAGAAALMSFDPRLVASSRRYAPSRPRGIVAVHPASANDGHVPAWQHWAGGNLVHLPWTRPHFIAYEAAALPAPVPIRIAQAFHLPLLAWTVRTLAEADRLAPHLDQIIFEGFAPREREGPSP